MTDPKCDKCGEEITTGMMAFFCPHGSECEFWPHDAPEASQIAVYEHWETNMKANLQTMADEVLKVTRENEALRKDAARYRRLRSSKTLRVIEVHPDTGEEAELCEGALDFAIDAALRDATGET